MCGGISLVRSLRQTAAAGRLGQRIEEIDLIRSHRLPLRPAGADVGSAHLNHLCHAAIGVILDELPGDDAAGAVADQHDLTIAFLAKIPHMLFQLRTIGDLIGGDCLSVREGEHVRFLRQPFDEQAIRFLPAVQMSAG